jgi:hypothetical protein
VHFRKQLNEVGEKGEQDDNRQRHTQKPQNSSPSHGSIPVDVFLTLKRQMDLRVPLRAKDLDL